MLSLFSSVGICRILRYGSSNTSTVEQQVCPRFFSGPSKFGEMRRCERKMLKCNAELVDIVFRLMFETFWVAPYDLRRSISRCWSDFERHARHASAVLLGKIDFALGLARRTADTTNWERPSAALDRAVRQIAEAQAAFRPLAVCRGASATASDRRHRAGACRRCRAACALPALVCCGSFARFANSCRDAGSARHACDRYCVAAGFCLMLPCAVLPRDNLRSVNFLRRARQKPEKPVSRSRLKRNGPRRMSRNE